MRDSKNVIVIPTYNTWNLTQNLVNDLIKYEKNNIDEIIIVDDASTMKGVVVPTNQSVSISYLANESNLGFTLTANKGLKMAVGELAEKRLVFLISNDVQVHGKFIEQAEDILFGARRAFVGNQHIVFGTGWNDFGSRVFDYLEGSFLACTSDGWKDIGFFDTNYAPFDMEDVDISTTAKMKGYKLVPLNNPNIVHLGAQTNHYSPERERITVRNKEYFARKWLK